MNENRSFIDFDIALRAVAQELKKVPVYQFINDDKPSDQMDLTQEDAMIAAFYTLYQSEMEVKGTTQAALAIIK